MPRLKNKYKQALEMRRKGFSLSEISKHLGVAKSTASVWTRDIKLSKKSIKRLKKKQREARKRSHQTRRRNQQKIEEELKIEATKFLDHIKADEKSLKIFCSLLFMCEGGKKDIDSGIYFTNSNPEIIKSFLFFLRSCFKTQEDKFRVLLHLHEYHSVKKQTEYWSKITGIPPSRFYNPYIKPNTGKRKRKNYPGCASLRYHDTKLAKEIYYIGKSVLKKYGGVG